MKKLIFILSCWLIAVAFANAQTLEQKKICALKWTLQQTFYNKSEGQQIARLDVTQYKTYADFKKDKLISAAIRKVSDATDQRRISNIDGATASTDIAQLVPSGGRKEFQEDCKKMKSVPSATPEPEEEQAPAPAEQPEAEPVNEPADIEVVQPEKQEETAQELPTEENAENVAEEPANKTSDGGMSFLEVALISLGINIVMAILLLMLLKQRKPKRNNDDTVSLEQYRSERMIMLERIKKAEIELDQLRAAIKSRTQQPQQRQEPKKPEPVQQPKRQEPEKDNTLFNQSKQPAKPATVQQPEPSVQPAQPTRPAQPVQPKATPATTGGKTTEVRHKTSIFFYPAPVDGAFINGSDEIEDGKSLYMLRTTDGVNGSFQILNNPSSIEKALADLNDTVRPACRIINMVDSPVEILAEKSGQVIREGDSWKIVDKAIVRLI